PPLTPWFVLGANRRRRRARQSWRIPCGVWKKIAQTGRLGAPGSATSERGGGRSQHALEEARHVALVGEAAHRGYLREREIVSPEQPTREIDATLDHVGMRRAAEAAAELAE